MAAMAVRKIKLTIRYDGSKYHGWQIQPGKKTIQGELSAAISSLVGKKVTAHAASRTDAGVSALGQVAVFEVDCPIPTDNFKDAINDRLPPEIFLTDVQEAPRNFDVIGQAVSKHYRYTIYTGPDRPVLQLNRCWHIPEPLDIAQMSKAAEMLLGTRDFKSFASSKDTRQRTVRTIFRCEVTSDGPWVYIDVEGDGFLYNMVRNIVGTLVEIGLGRWKAEKVPEILEARHRSAAGRLAPPNGLCLMQVKY